MLFACKLYASLQLTPPTHPPTCVSAGDILLRLPQDMAERICGPAEGFRLHCLLSNANAAAQLQQQQQLQQSPLVSSCPPHQAQFQQYTPPVTMPARHGSSGKRRHDRSPLERSIAPPAPHLTFGSRDSSFTTATNTAATTTAATASTAATVAASTGRGGLAGAGGGSKQNGRCDGGACARGGGADDDGNQEDDETLWAELT